MVATTTANACNWRWRWRSRISSSKAATRNGKISGAISDMLTPLQLDHYWSSSSRISFLYIRGASRRGLGSVVGESWRSCASRGPVTQVVGASYGGRAAVPSISREGVTQKSCRVTATQSIIKVTEQSAWFSHGGVTAFTECRVTGVLGKSSNFHFLLVVCLEIYQIV